MTSTIEHDIIVVGAGIVGLATALALRADGHDVAVVEQAAAVRAEGVGIQLAPNAVRPLAGWGLGPALLAGGAAPERVTVADGLTGSPLLTHALGAEAQEAFGAPYLTFRRSQLVRTLADRLEPERLHVATRIEHVTTEPGRVEAVAASGVRVRARLLVAADGISSSVRALLWGDPPAVSTGMSAYRGVVPPVSTDDSRQVRVWVGEGRHAVSYPVGGGLVGFTAVVSAGEAADSESWDTLVGGNAVRRAFEGWTPAWTDLLHGADGVGVWGLRRRATVGGTVRGNVVLVGDAAHPMLPFGAHGAGQGIEDAASLASALACPPAQWGAALAAHETRRRARVARVADEVARKAAHHHGDQRGSSGLAAAAQPVEIPLASQAWLYGHDATRTAAA